MNKLTNTCVVIVAILSLDQSAGAAPVSFRLTLTPEAHLNFVISALGGSTTSSIPFDLTGGFDVRLDGEDPISSSIDLSDQFTNIDLSDEPFMLDLGFLGGISAEFTGLDIKTLYSANIPLTNVSTANPFSSTFDPGHGGGTSLFINEGVLTYVGTGPVGSLLGSGTIDFGNEFFEIGVYSVGQIGLLIQDVTITDDTAVVDVFVSAPLSFRGALLTDPTPIDMELSGALVGTGSYTYIVPEPSSLVLLGIAAVGLVPFLRRVRN